MSVTQELEYKQFDKDGYTWRCFFIQPRPKPRMTLHDRRRTARYDAFREALIRMIHIRAMSNAGSRVFFIIPMPKSWPESQKLKMDGAGHEGRCDVDNLLKGFMDAAYTKGYSDDGVVWDVHPTKIWGREGAIIVKDPIAEYKTDPDLDQVRKWMQVRHLRKGAM